jgi:hypothetical protein
MEEMMAPRPTFIFGMPAVKNKGGKIVPNRARIGPHTISPYSL